MWQFSLAVTLSFSSPSSSGRGPGKSCVCLGSALPCSRLPAPSAEDKFHLCCFPSTSFRCFPHFSLFPRFHLPSPPALYLLFILVFISSSLSRYCQPFPWINLCNFYRNPIIKVFCDSVLKVENWRLRKTRNLPKIRSYNWFKQDSNSGRSFVKSLNSYLSHPSIHPFIIILVFHSTNTCCINAFSKWFFRYYVWCLIFMLRKMFTLFVWWEREREREVECLGNR